MKIQAEAATDYIDEIFSDLTFSDFLDRFWERKPKLRRSAFLDPSHLFDTAVFEKFISSSSSNSMHIPNIVSGQVARPMREAEIHAPANSAIAAYSAGATILASGIEAGVSTVEILCRQLDNAFLSHGLPLKQAAFANAYLTPASSQGFGAHYDDHCVFVLQMQGCKHWVVGPPSKALPSERCTEVLPDEMVKTRLVETELEAGDVLYIPRGFVHFAHCTEEPSLHLTIGVRTLTWAELMPRLASQLDVFRESVKPVSGDGLGADGYYTNRLIASLGSIKPTTVLLNELGMSLSALTPMTSSSGNRFSSVRLTERTILRRNQDVLVMLVTGQSEVTLHFPGGQLELPLAMETALAFVADMERFAVGDIPSGSADFERLKFARLLISKGIVSAETEEQMQVEIVT